MGKKAFDILMFLHFQLESLTFIFSQYQMLPSGEKQSYGAVLELLNVTRRDSGLYICEAANGVDNPVSAKIDLKIICKFKSISSIGSGSVIHTFHIFRRTGNPG